MTATSTVGMTREAWLAERKKSIGGSDAAAIIGLSKWATPYSVWAEKTGKLPEKEDTEAMRIGRDLEDYVAQRFMEATGKHVRRRNAILYNEAWPFAHANVDRLVDGERAGLECKTTNTLNVKQFHGTDFPEQYYAQCVHYLAVTGLDKWYLAVLCIGRGFFVYELERDEGEINALMDAEARFWNLVENDTPPDVDGAEATTDALTAIYREDNGDTVQLIGRDMLLSEYAALKRNRAALDERITAIENTIKQDMGEAGSAESTRYKVTWRAQERSTFQPKAFHAAHPDIDLMPYYKKTICRPFKVAEIKEEDNRNG